MDMADLKQAIQSCNVEEIKRLVEDENCDVNQNLWHETDWRGKRLTERPLSFSLENIKSENDDWFKISRMLLDHKNIDVNAECRITYFNVATHTTKVFGRTERDIIAISTILGYVCNTKCESALGVKMLLEDPRTDVNKGGPQTSLYCALRNVQNEGDYFHQIAELLLHHKNIDVNADCYHPFFSIDYIDSTLSALCLDPAEPYKLGVQILLQDSRVHIYKGSPTYWAACHRRTNILKMILKHPDHDVNKVCECCDNYLPIAMITRGV